MLAIAADDVHIHNRQKVSEETCMCGVSVRNIPVATARGGEIELSDDGMKDMASFSVV